LASNDEKTRDLAVLQLLTRLVRETDRIVRLADDIDNYAETKQAKDAFLLIGDEVEKVLKTIDKSISPLYRLYEIDPGLQSIADPVKSTSKSPSAKQNVTAEIISRQEK